MKNNQLRIAWAGSVHPEGISMKIVKGVFPEKHKEFPNQPFAFHQRHEKRKDVEVHRNVKSIVAARRIVGKRNKENIKQAIWINGFGQGIVIK